MKDIFLEKIYSKSLEKRKKYGTYKKCEFHIHTPESGCYRFHTDNETLKKYEEYEIKKENNERDLEPINLEGNYTYSSKTIEEILEIARDNKYIDVDKYNSIRDNLKEYKGITKKYKIGNEEKEYRSFKEYLVYKMIAYRLFTEEIEIAVLSDHNTVQGFYKLKHVIEETYTEKGSIIKPVKLFLGIEISCSDKNHLIAILDENKYDSINSWLEENIMRQEFGTYKSTYDVINELEAFNAITYIAHANSSDLYGNKAYKLKLFNHENLHGFGIKREGSINKLICKIKDYNKQIENKLFVLEADSHAINEIGRKNCWIKFGKVDFTSLKKAVLNHGICIKNTKPIESNIVIRGMVIESGENGFLASKDHGRGKYFSLDFSSDLNCIIGGRGTGKSTVLNVLETILTQEAENEEILEFISQHKLIYIVVSYSNEDYIIEFIPQVAKNKGYDKFKFHSGAIVKDKTIKLNMSWYEIYKVNDGHKRRYEKLEKGEGEQFLKLIFRRGYNINKLVEKINRKEISQYVSTVMGYNDKYYEIGEFLAELKSKKVSSIVAFIKKDITRGTVLINNRVKYFKSYIEQFNSENYKKITLKYVDRGSYSGYYEKFLELLFYSNGNNKSIDNTYLTWSGLQRYFADAIKYWDFYHILSMILNEKLVEMDSKLHLSEYYTIEKTFKTIENDYKEIDKTIIKNINKQLITTLRNKKEKLREIIIESFEVVDNINIKFNINYKEDAQTLPVCFKDIKQLSLGQKVAALLMFVFSYGKIANDNTPLIIDQPEDNLDNTYIYRTLVGSLKNIKNSRQVIIVTHSSTIVTNADAEQVIVMESNERNGWITHQGYPSEKSTTNHILNYLEGGPDSFNHKSDMYKLVLKH